MSTSHTTLTSGITVAVVLLAAACGGGDDGPPLSGAAEQGRRLYTSSGCAGCHGGDLGGGVGPQLAGIVGTERELDDGSTVIADEAYLRRSIIDPAAERVAGYSLRMPTNGLDDAEVDQVVAYLVARSQEQP